MLRAANAFLVLACAAPGPSAAPQPMAPAPGLTRQDAATRKRELEGQVYDLLQRGDYERLRDVVGQLEELQIEPLLAAAKKSLREGDGPAALSKIEQALERAPDGPTGRLLHGEACLAFGSEPPERERLSAGLASYLQAAASPPRWLPREERREFRARALLGASRTATVLGDREQALEHARACLETVAAIGGRNVRNRLDEWPEKRLFDAAFDLYAELRTADPARAAELVREMEAALRLPLAKNPGAAWPWTSLAALYLDEGRFGEARDTAFDGLARHPFDATLPGQLTEAARGIGGSGAVYAALALLKQRTPAAARPWWYSARERFDEALEALPAAPAEELERAEAEFRRCRELDPALERECLSYEVLCRSAAGWTHLAAGRLAEAEAAFLSMEAVLPRGLAADLPGLLDSGLEGLDRVGRGYFERDELDRAAAVYATLHAYEPESAAWAARAGQLQRDAGERWQVQAEAARRLAANPERDGERAAELLRAAGLAAPAAGDEAGWSAGLEHAAQTLAQRAEVAFEASYGAYRAAAELAPTDVRVLCDAALLPIHHLGRDLEWAERTLLACVALGREQLADPALGPEARLALTQAWGDAHQSLGVLCLEHKGDRSTARAWFEKSLAIGPDPRPIIEEEYLPRCNGTAASEVRR